MPNTERIIFSRTAGPVSIKAGETILATSNNAVVLTENGYTPRLYLGVKVAMNILVEFPTNSLSSLAGSYHHRVLVDDSHGEASWTTRSKEFARLSAQL